MKRWLHEPLLHFCVVGGLLFIIHAWLNPEPGIQTRSVHISASEVDWLKQLWTRQWRRAPDERELRELVGDYLKEVLLSLEARELGLDQNDTVVRRRLAQKMEFLVDDSAINVDPSDTELHNFYETHGTQYQLGPEISFCQIYFQSEAAARRGLKDLDRLGADSLGDPILLDRVFDHAGEKTIASLFGQAFADKVLVLSSGPWHGPIASGYGFHLVRINDRRPAQALSFEQVRTRVLEEWRQVQRAKVKQQYFAGLMKKYEVVVDDAVKPYTGSLAQVRP